MCKRGIELGGQQVVLHGSGSVGGIDRSGIRLIAGGAVGKGSCAGSILRGSRDRSVDAEGLAEPEDSQQHGKHEWQNGRGLGDLSAAGFAGELPQIVGETRPQAAILSFQKVP